jgi:hypothetical protein
MLVEDATVTHFSSIPFLHSVHTGRGLRGGGVFSSNIPSLRDLRGVSQFKIQNSKFSIPAGLTRRQPIQNLNFFPKFSLQQSHFKIKIQNRFKLHFYLILTAKRSQ